MNVVYYSASLSRCITNTEYQILICSNIKKENLNQNWTMQLSPKHSMMMWVVSRHVKFDLSVLFQDVSYEVQASKRHYSIYEFFVIRSVVKCTSRQEI
jgi:hypothetical protein